MDSTSFLFFSLTSDEVELDEDEDVLQLPFEDGSMGLLANFPSFFISRALLYADCQFEGRTKV